MKKLLRAILPIIAIIIVLIINALAGIILAIAYIGYTLYQSRSTIYKYVAWTKNSKGDMDATLSWLKKSYECKNSDPRTSVTYSYLLLKAAKVDEAESILNTIISSNRSEEAVNLAKSNLALSTWKKGNLKEAVTMLEEVFANYKTTTIYGSLGYMYILEGDLEKALQFNLEAYDYNSSNTVIQDNLGQTYYLMGETDKAVEIYEKLMPSNPAFPEAYYNYALVLEKKDDFGKALEIAEKALNYKFTYLSTVSREEVESKAEALRKLSVGALENRNEG